MYKTRIMEGNKMSKKKPVQTAMDLIDAVFSKMTTETSIGELKNQFELSMIKAGIKADNTANSYHDIMLGYFLYNLREYMSGSKVLKRVKE